MTSPTLTIGSGALDLRTNLYVPYGGTAAPEDLILAIPNTIVVRNTTTKDVYTFGGLFGPSPTWPPVGGIITSLQIQDASGNTILILSGFSIDTFTYIQSFGIFQDWTGFIAAALGPNGIIIGGAGDDTLFALAGSHSFDGGGGSNTIDYTTAPGPITIDLATGVAANGFGGTDTLTRIQNVEANGAGNQLLGGVGPGTLTVSGDANHLQSGTGHWTLTATGSGNTLVGGTGSTDFVVDGTGNTLTGGAGDDDFVVSGAGNSISGGSGTNTLDYTHATQAVTVDFSTDLASNNTSFSGIQVVKGSPKGTTVIGGVGPLTFVSAGGSTIPETVRGGTGPVTLDLSQISTQGFLDLVRPNANFTNVSDIIGSPLGGSYVFGQGVTFQVSAFGVNPGNQIFGRAAAPINPPFPLNWNGYVSLAPDGAFWTYSNGVVTRYHNQTTTNTYGANVSGVVAAPDGSAWASRRSGASAGDLQHISQSGATLADYAVHNDPGYVSASESGDVWTLGTLGIGHLSGFGYSEITLSQLTAAGLSFDPASTRSVLADIDGSFWFSTGTAQIGHISATGQIGFVVASGAVASLASDGFNIWYTLDQRPVIGEITPTGTGNFALNERVVPVQPVPDNLTYDGAITATPDDAVWFLGVGGVLGRLSPQGVFTEYVVNVEHSNNSLATQPLPFGLAPAAYPGSFVYPPNNGIVVLTSDGVVPFAAPTDANTLDFSAWQGGSGVTITATGHENFDVFRGSQFNDTFIAGNSSATFYGGGGGDTFQTTLSRSAVTMTGLGNDAFTLSTATGLVYTLHDIDNVAFSSGTVHVACFVHGTHILTPCGEVPVQHLAINAQVLTLRQDGSLAAAAIKWIGRRRIDLGRQRYPELLAPIRISRNAIADGVPTRDVCISPDHAVIADDRLIQVKMLVNGGSIASEPTRSRVDYFHIELERHAILLADGLPSESYLDTGDRSFFANHATTSLYPELQPAFRPGGAVVPLTTDAELVAPIWNRLARRSAALGFTEPPRVETEADVVPCLAVDGRIIRPVRVRPGAFSFALPPRASAVRLVSGFHVPANAKPWEDDRRRLGLCVSRLAVRCGAEFRDMPLDHPALTTGWWSVERDDGAFWRWTDGDASLPLDAEATRLDLWIRCGAPEHPLDLFAPRAA